MERVIGSSDEYQGLVGAIDEDKLDLRVVRDRVPREGLQHLQELSGLMASALQTIIEIGEDEEVWREAS